jgi:PAS domain S-box-containing protein
MMGTRKNKTIVLVLLSMVLTILFMSSIFSSVLKAQENNIRSRILVDASSNNFPPMNSLDENGNLTGFGREFADAVLAAVGATVTHIHSSHWVEVLDWLDSGKADFIHDTGYTKEREEFLDYSNPIIEMPEMIFVRLDQYDITGFDSLKGKKVACVNQHISHLYLKNFPGITCYVVKTPVEGLYELISGKVDAFVYPKQIILYLAQNLRLTDKIKMTGDPLRILTWSMVVKKGNTEILTLLNEGIDKVRGTDEYDRIYNKWWGKKVLAGYSERELRVIISITVGISMVVVSLIALLFYNYKLRVGQKRLKKEIFERKQIEEALQAANNIINRSPAVAFLWKNAKGWPVEFVSTNVKRLFGYTAEEFTSGKVSYVKTVHPDDMKRVAQEVTTCSEEGREDFVHKPYRIVTKDGETKWLDDMTFIKKDKKGNITHYEGIVVDISERVKAEEEKAQLEEQYYQAQKVESIGRLAGGVSHDLNNLLTPILGYSEILIDDFELDDARRETVNEILRAGFRARDLVRQLLAFSRKQTLEYRPVNMNKAVEDFEKLLMRTIKENIKIEIILSPDIRMVMADIGQIEQVIMNLAVNAADAMPDGGKLTMETAMIDLDGDYAAEHLSTEVGQYVMLAISDSGCGMDDKTREHMFEPFFSTKGKQGTGLGLATVYGIVKQHGGNIWVYSEPGIGTTFKVYLPASEEIPVIDTTGKKRVTSMKGSETILLVEDNEQVRRLGQTILERQGYTVFVAGNGIKALAVFEEYGGLIQLLLTDVIMPGMDGKELFVKAAAKYPDLKVLYMSGYTGNVIVHRGVLNQKVQFIQKPFTNQGLLTKVREVLDQD